MEHILYIGLTFFAGLVSGVGLATFWSRDAVHIPESPDIDFPEEAIPLFAPNLRSRRVEPKWREDFDRGRIVVPPTKDE